MVRTTWRAATLALLATLAACAEDPLDEMPDAAQVGTLERAEIDTTIRSHLHGIRACTHRALVSGEAEEGEIRVRFVIAADGTVSSAKVASSTLPDVVGDCILAVFDEMVFPEPRGGGIVIVTYPFVFASG